MKNSDTFFKRLNHLKTYTLFKKDKIRGTEIYHYVKYSEINLKLLTFGFGIFPPMDNFLS